MGKLLNIRNSIKSKIDEQFNKLKEKREKAAKKRLAARLKYMNDDELEDYIMLQIQKLQKGSKETKREVKNAVVAAIQSMDEPEKQLELTAQISDELTKRDKSQIIESIDSTAALLDDNGIDIIKEIDKSQKLEIVERIIANQKIKAGKGSIGEIAGAVDKIYCLTNEANDFTLLKYIETVQARINKLKEQKDITKSEKKQINQTQLKLIKLAAKKVVCNYKYIGYSMRIREFMNAALSDRTLEEIYSAVIETKKDEKEQKATMQSRFLDALKGEGEKVGREVGSDSLFLDTIKDDNLEPRNIMKPLFLDIVEVEGNKIGLKNAKIIIGDLLAQEEERYRIGEIKKIQRDSGKDAVKKIAEFIAETDDDARS